MLKLTALDDVHENDSKNVNRREAVIQLLIDCVVDETIKPGYLFCPDQVEFLDGRSRYGEKTNALPLVILHDALRRGDADMVDFLLERGYDMGNIEYYFTIFPSLKKSEVENQEIVGVLKKHKAPFKFDGLCYTVDK
ncbi:hypothetical protein BDV19DRAFT_390690 [Aspergillus venezuelensis]